MIKYFSEIEKYSDIKLKENNIVIEKVEGLEGIAKKAFNFCAPYDERIVIPLQFGEHEEILLSLIKTFYVKDDDIYLPKKSFFSGQSFYGFVITDLGKSFTHKAIEEIDFEVDSPIDVGDKTIIPIKIITNPSAEGNYDLNFFEELESNTKVVSEKFVKPEVGRVIRNEGTTYFVRINDSIVKIERKDLKQYDDRTESVIEGLNNKKIIVLEDDDTYYKLTRVGGYPIKYAFIRVDGQYWHELGAFRLRESTIKPYVDKIKVFKKKEYLKWALRRES